MAVVVVDRDEVKPVGGSVRVSHVKAKSAITQGQPVTKDATTRDYFPSVNDTVANVDTDGFALTPAPLAGDYFLMLNLGGSSVIFLGTGVLDTAAGVQEGVPFCVGDAAGDIVPYADLGAADEVKLLGVSSSASELDTNLNNIKDIIL